MADDPQKVQSNVAKIRAAGGSDADVDAYLGSIGAVDVTQPVHRPLTKPQIQRLAKSQAEKNAVDREGLPWQASLPEAPVKKFLAAAALPLQGLPGGEAAEAAIGSAAGNTDYQTALQTQRETTDRVGPGGQMVLKGVGGVAGMAIPGAPTLLSKLAGQAALGAVYGASDADPNESVKERLIRATGGAVAAPAIGWGLGALAGTNMAARSMGKVAEAIKDDPALVRLLGAVTPQAASKSFTKMATPAPTAGLSDALAALEQWGGLSNAERSGAKRLASASARDKRAGLRGAPAFPERKGMPQTLGADVASPSVIEEARGAVRSTPGREALVPALEARNKEAVSSITEGMPDAMKQRYQMAEARKIRAKEQMEAALEATTGKPIDLTPELDEVLSTPAGKAAGKSAMRSRLNVPERPLPEVPIKPAAQVEGYESTEFIPPGTEETRPVLDAEGLHLVTRALRRMAQGEAGQSKPAGKAASDAIASGALKDRVVESLPPEFQQFMDEYRAASQEISALDLGRVRHPLNPTGLGKSDKSLTDVERQVRAMTPEQRNAYQAGKQHDLASRLRGGQSVESMASEMGIPGGATAREAALSGSDIAPRVAAWNRASETTQRIGGGVGPARVRTGEGLTMDVVAPTESWAIVRALREAFGKLSDTARENQGLRDAAFSRILAQPKNVYEKELADALRAEGWQGVARKIGTAGMAINGMNPTELRSRLP